MDGLYRCSEHWTFRGDIFELGSGENYSINEVAGAFGDYPYDRIPKRDGEMRETLNTDTKAQDVLGWKPNGDIIKFIKLTSEAGCETFYIHARNAILNGLSTRKNRSVPPLRYDDVMTLKETFPHLKVYINGGIVNLEDLKELLAVYGGVMLGRKIYDDPMFLNDIEKKIFFSNNYLSTQKVISRYIDQLEPEDNQNKLFALRHLTNLHKGTCYAKKWRKYFFQCFF